MKVLLIHPPWYRLLGGEFSGVPLGLSYLAGALERGGHDVKVYNADMVKAGLGLPPDTLPDETYINYKHALSDLNDPIWGEIRSTLADEKPDVVGISVRTPHYPSALNVSRMVKELSPKIPVIWGGVHPTIMPAECLTNGDVDFVVRGEGEYTLTELLKNLGSPDKVPGISYKRDNDVVHNSDRPLVQNLDEIPYPARDRIIGYERMQPEAFGHLFATRGCPYQCTFCASHWIWSRRVRYRTIANIVDEIISVKKKYKTSRFIFEDDSFTVNRKFVEDFCNAVIDMKLGITWRCETRVDLVNPQLIALMKRSGLDEISLGIESGSANSLKRIKKGITVEQVRNAVKVIKAARLRFGAFFIIGFPWETKEDINATLDLIQEVDADVLGLNMATPYPGTEVYEICKSEGLLSENVDYGSFFFVSPDVCLSKKIPREEMLEIVNRSQHMMERHNRKKFRQLVLKHPLYALKRFISGKYYYPGSLKAILRQLR